MWAASLRVNQLSQELRASRCRPGRGLTADRTREEPGKPRERQRDALDGAGSTRLVLVREPDQLGVERAHPQLAFGVRLIELAEPNRHVAADDDRTPASLDDDHLQAACVARRRDEPEPGKQLDSPSTGTYRTPGASTHSRMV
jgi:hypothetical protein